MDERRGAQSSRSFRQSANPPMGISQDKQLAQAGAVRLLDKRQKMFELQEALEQEKSELLSKVSYHFKSLPFLQLPKSFCSALLSLNLQAICHLALHSLEMLQAELYASLQCFSSMLLFNASLQCFSSMLLVKLRPLTVYLQSANNIGHICKVI